MSKRARTRFAPSPTGFMHVGNLRTALYEYLIAKALGGDFILRIEDTDQERQVAGAVERIYETLQACGLQHDEGPDKPGDCGPYVQSERLGIYLPVAQQLVASGHAYYCFCSEERLESLREQPQEGQHPGYDRHCRNLSPEEVQARLDAGEPYVIRQKMPLEGETSFDDAVYGTITVPNAELEDQILIKSDGYPTYNFANVVDDHAMRITHIVRGSEYLSSTPKYVLLYEALGYEVPAFVHLPLILGADGQKLSKRHGATSFTDLVADGYLPEAIVNYLAMLGWAPSNSQEEFFSLKALEEGFTISGLSRSPSVFDYQKLAWFNAHYIRELPLSDLVQRLRPFWSKHLAGQNLDQQQEETLASMLQPRLERLNDAQEQLAFLDPVTSDYDLGLYEHRKMKTTADLARQVLEQVTPLLDRLEDWTHEGIYACCRDFAQTHELKNGQVMWPLRVALSGLEVTPGGASELAVVLGKEESLKRLQQALTRLQKELN